MAAGREDRGHRATCRRPRQVSWLKSLSSRWFYRLLDAIGDVRIEPGSADFLLLDRVAVDTINGFESREIFLRGLVRWLGYPLAKLTFTQGVRQSRRNPSSRFAA